jgi:aminoacyl tRNA synthase complex-interacting multifunctional protein 1
MNIATSSYLYLLFLFLSSFQRSIVSFQVMFSPMRKFSTVAIGKYSATAPNLMKCSRFYCSSATVSDSSSSPPTPATPINTPDLELLEIRIGQITEVVKHPGADNLYIEKVNLGEESGPRTVVSGLVKFITAESLLNRKVVVLCNLKPRKFLGVLSEGMLLCASNADHSAVEPLIPPADSPVGELVQFAGNSIKPAEPGNKPAKAFGNIITKFVVNDQGVATFDNIPFMTSAGAVTCNLKGQIS